MIAEVEIDRRRVRAAVYAKRRLARRMNAQPRRVTIARRRAAMAIYLVELHDH